MRCAIYQSETSIRNSTETNREPVKPLPQLRAESGVNFGLKFFEKIFRRKMKMNPSEKALLTQALFARSRRELAAVWDTAWKSCRQDAPVFTARDAQLLHSYVHDLHEAAGWVIVFAVTRWDAFLERVRAETWCVRAPERPDFSFLVQHSQLAHDAALDSDFLDPAAEPLLIEAQRRYYGWPQHSGKMGLDFSVLDD
jgi:hypothetical protein